MVPGKWATAITHSDEGWGAKNKKTHWRIFATALKLVRRILGECDV